MARVSGEADRPEQLRLRGSLLDARAARARLARPRTSAALGVCASALLLGALAWPLLFTGATFNDDWLNHLWYMWHQSLAIRSEHHPSLFLSYSGGVLYPFYAFYGATLYATAGALSLALGNAPLQTYVLTYMIGFAAAYGGWYWMARTFGLTGWPAHLPGVVFVTSAYYLTMVYGLGDWPEFLAVSAVPPTIASALSVLRAPRLRAAPALALVASTVLFCGSHLLTAIWGATLLALLAGAIVLCVPGARRGVTRAGARRLFALAVPAALVNAWFLLPAAAYESRTAVAHSYPHFRELLRSTMYTVAARHLFTLSRAKASGTVVTVALPVLAIAWVIASIAILLAARQRGTWMRLLLLLSAATAALLVLMTHAGLLLALPRAYSILQFGFRIEIFALMCLSGALLAALVLLGRGGGRMRLWRGLLIPIALVSIAGALAQVGGYTPGPARAGALRSYLTPPTPEREGLLGYVDDELPTLRRKLPLLRLPPGGVGEHAAGVARLGGGRLLDTNIRSLPGLVHVDGGRIVATDARANDVLEVPSAPRSRRGPHGAASRTARIAVGPSDDAPVLAGRLLSALALLALATQLVGALARRLRPRAALGRRGGA
jgi:hypothetical protein